MFGCKQQEISNNICERMSEGQYMDEESYDVDQYEYEDWSMANQLRAVHSNDKPYNVCERPKLISKIYQENQEKSFFTYLPQPWNLMLYSFCSFNAEELLRLIDLEQTGRAMIRFDENYVPSVSQGECPVCCQEAELIANPCNHRFCLECWAGHLENSHCNRSVYELFPMCPESECFYRTNMLLMQKVWQTAPKLKEDFEQLLVVKYARQSDHVKLCKREGCPKVIYINMACEGVIECECGQKLCRICGENDHQPLSCGELTLWNALAIDKQNNWIGELVTQQCPMCKAYIDKNGGCIHMTCRCKHEFCWICLKVWKGHKDYSACSSVKKEDHERTLLQKQMKLREKDNNYNARFEQAKSEVERSSAMLQRVRKMDVNEIIGKLVKYHILSNKISHLKDLRDAMADSLELYKKSIIYIFLQLSAYQKLEVEAKLLQFRINQIDEYFEKKIKTINFAEQLCSSSETTITSETPQAAIEIIQQVFSDPKSTHTELLNSTKKLCEQIRQGNFMR